MPAQHQHTPGLRPCPAAAAAAAAAAGRTALGTAPTAAAAPPTRAAAGRPAARRRARVAGSAAAAAAAVGAGSLLRRHGVGQAVRTAHQAHGPAPHASRRRSHGLQHTHTHTHMHTHTHTRARARTACTTIAGGGVSAASRQHVHVRRARAAGQAGTHRVAAGRVPAAGRPTARLGACAGAGAGQTLARARLAPCHRLAPAARPSGRGQRQACPCPRPRRGHPRPCAPHAAATAHGAARAWLGGSGHEAAGCGRRARPALGAQPCGATPRSDTGGAGSGAEQHGVCGYAACCHAARRLLQGTHTHQQQLAGTHAHINPMSAACNKARTRRLAGVRDGGCRCWVGSRLTSARHAHRAARRPACGAWLGCRAALGPPCLRPAPPLLLAWQSQSRRAAGPAAVSTAAGSCPAHCRPAADGVRCRDHALACARGPAAQALC
jgi:hypothetical protein